MPASGWLRVSVVISPLTETLCTTAASPACGSAVAAGSSVNVARGGTFSVPATPLRVVTVHSRFPVAGSVAGREGAGQEHLPGRGLRAADLAGRHEGAAAAGTWMRRHLPDTPTGWPGAICWPPVTGTDEPDAGASMPGCRVYGGSWLQLV